jgi:hypothetical protein
MSKEPQSTELPTIAADELGSVTGGITQAATDPNATMETMLQGLLTSIQQLAQSQQSGGGAMSQMMPMMMMMMGNRNSQPAAPPPPEVAVGGVTPGGWTRVS